MAVKATVDKFGMTFSNAYHKINRLNYESFDSKKFNYALVGPALDEEGNPIPPIPVAPEEVWTKDVRCNFEVVTYASEETRDQHAEPIYRTNFNFNPSTEAEASDIIVQAYEYLKGQSGYEDAINC